MISCKGRKAEVRMTSCYSFGFGTGFGKACLYSSILVYMPCCHGRCDKSGVILMHAALSVLQLLTTTTQLLWNVLHFFYLIMLRFEHGLNAVTFKGKMSVRFAVQI